MKDHKSTVEKLFENIGIEEGQKLLDFGCGLGYYTLPAAELVGKEGIVYAVDKDKSKLDKLEREAQDLDSANIQIVNSQGGTDLSFPDEIMDVVLLYDVFSYFDLSSQGLDDLLEEMYRLSKQSGLLSVYPKHVDTAELKSKIGLAGFNFQESYSGTLLHDGKPEKGTILNFTKIKKTSSF